jgi:hypothetical protein
MRKCLDHILYFKLSYDSSGAVEKTRQEKIETASTGNDILS